MRSPAGSDGLIVQVSTIPPELEGVSEEIAVETTPLIVVGE